MTRGPTLRRWGGALLLALTMVLAELAPVRAWKPDTHVRLGEIVLRDALDDGYLTLYRIDPDAQEIAEILGRFQVRSSILESLRQYPDHFRFGVVGPDAFPDILTGQQIIHPDAAKVIDTSWSPGGACWTDSPGTSGPGSDAWLSHLWKSAFRTDSPSPWKAFVVGYLVHAAGDMYAHTYVNHFAGGPFVIGPNAVRHIVLESYMGDRAPGRSPELGDLHIAGIEAEILYQMTIYERGSVLDRELLVGPGERFSIPRIYTDLRHDLHEDIEAYQKKRDELGFGAKQAYITTHGPVIAYKKAWKNDIDDGLRMWPEVSSRIAKSAMFGAEPPASEIASAYVRDHLLSMAGLPDFIGLTAKTISQITDALIPDPIQERIEQMKEDLLDYMFQHAFGMSYDTFKHPATHFDDVMSNAQPGAVPITKAEFDRDELKVGASERDRPCPLQPSPSQSADFVVCLFPPAYNTVAMTQLILLDPPEVNRALQALGSPARLYSPNAMLGFMRSLDESEQWRVGPRMVVARDPAAYRQVFMTQKGETRPEGPFVGIVPIDVESIRGNWLRSASNNPVNDGMRIRVEGNGATLTAMPERSPTTFRAGQVLWKEITEEGTLEVRGSDGRYYSACATVEGEDRVHIDIDNNPGPGYDQTWRRAGPSIDGEWVLVAGGEAGDRGMRIRVEGDQATLHYVPAAASRAFRTGDIVWRAIGAGEQSNIGQLEALSSDRSYRVAEFRLQNEDRLRLVHDADGAVQGWARPGAAEELLAQEQVDGYRLAFGLTEDAASLISRGEATLRELFDTPDMTYIEVEGDEPARLVLFVAGIEAGRVTSLSWSAPFQTEPGADRPSLVSVVAGDETLPDGRFSAGDQFVPGKRLVPSSELLPRERVAGQGYESLQIVDPRPDLVPEAIRRLLEDGLEDPGPAFPLDRPSEVTAVYVAVVPADASVAAASQSRPAIFIVNGTP